MKWNETNVITAVKKKKAVKRERKIKRKMAE